MFDFISLILKTKLTPYLRGEEVKYQGGYWPLKDKHEPLKVFYNKRAGSLRIEGSLPYYLQGHNFSFCMNPFANTIRTMIEQLHVNLWYATVEKLEYGVIVEVPRDAYLYILAHHSKQGEGLVSDWKKTDKLYLRWFKDKESGITIKLYDVQHNMRRKHISYEDIPGYNPKAHYLKIEIHYDKPYNVLNGGREFYLYNLLQPSWIERLNEDLLKQYHRLEAYSEVCMPKDKKDADCIDIAVITFCNEVLKSGGSIEDAKRLFYQEIKRLRDDGILTCNDVKARQAILRKTLKKIRCNIDYDLTDYIKKELSNRRH